MADYADLFNEYEKILAGADRAFNEVSKEHGACIKCDVGCSDCCHAVFGLFPIEALYLNYHFGLLDEEARRESLKRGEAADKTVLEMQKQLEQCGDDQTKMNQLMARTRVRCPLLTEGDSCRMYQNRPVTCRVYGIPTRAGGQARVCWKAGFEKERSYPAFDLDKVYRELHRLSVEALRRAEQEDSDLAGLLVSVSQAIR